MEGKTDDGRLALTGHATALFPVLKEEFGIVFTFYDALHGDLLSAASNSSRELNVPDLKPAAVQELAVAGKALVKPLPGNRFQLSVVLQAARNRPLLAVGVANSVAQAGECSGSNCQDGSASEQERKMLQSWLQAVCDRLTLAEQLASRRRDDGAQTNQGTAAWEALLALDQVTRRLRVHKDHAHDQQRILEAAINLLPMQALMWIPLQRDQNTLVTGQSDYAPEECRQLADQLTVHPDFRPPAPLLCNNLASSTLGSRFRTIRNLLAFRGVEADAKGWLIALNKKGENPFRRSDAALLLPFLALLELHLRWSHRYQDLKELLAGLTRSLTTALDAKDAYTFGHSERVARIAVELGRELGMAGEELGDLYLAGLLHDVGKIGVKDTVLHKPAPLTLEEQEHVRQHVTIGYWILAELRPIRNLLPGVLYHHERFDGKGYPDGLAGINIPLLARILAVADAYDAMSHQRAYRDSLPYRKVEEELQRGAGTQWDSSVVEAFMRCRQRIHAIRQRGVGDSLRQAIDGALRSSPESIRPKPPLAQVDKED